MDRDLRPFVPVHEGGSRVAAGCMTGTSIDALDVVWIEATGFGLDLRAKVVDYRRRDLGPLREPLRSLCRQEPATAPAIARLARDLGALHADVIAPEDRSGAPPHPDLIVVHGQTVAHDGEASWALFDPRPLIARVDSTVVTDLRLVDQACDGEGAPITPLADWIFLRGPEPRCVVNLGGFCNVTFLPAEDEPHSHVEGRDVGPCNQLLDEAARRFLGEPFDVDGAAAAGGQVHGDVAASLVRGLIAIGGRGRSLGTGDEGFHLLDALEVLPPGDALATLSTAVALSIARGLVGRGRVLLFGGGARNLALVDNLRGAVPDQPVQIGDDGASGLTPESREGAAMAVLGLLAADGVAVTLPAVTGRGETLHLDGRWILPR
ncbi:anhydro-N-acetylmuramic acid kinase [Engelhardtia mirabilis]|uniref:Anhydro-N-acetylmuramic acid kinase n=1 Tax=Engelhardtia mirabilis TaxID=2528011 RepID=A0A518BHM7_9BACT|nr:Anhydro-N-acetylmuramic acid kinase [Planctomycetes bacterium Pla133]QDV00807.1 Anhydro-N-acetylmuramic acid kinase [Planctomycetes bacterium Pla86]